jgi:hypothetical protein
VTRFDPAEWYHGHGGVMRRIDPDVPTGICGVCAERYPLRRDGTVRMHTRAAQDGESGGTWHWCDGGMPAGAR